MSKATGVVLDIGCGSRPYARMLSAGVTEYIGIDNPATMPPGTRPDLSANGLALPIKGQAVDTVLCFEVLNYIADPYAFFREISRVLRPGGRFLLSSPLMRGISDEAADYFRFTPGGISLLTDAAGLTVEDIDFCGGLWAMVGQRVSSAIVRKAKTRRSKRWVYAWCCGFVQCTGLFLDRLWCEPSECLHTLVAGTKPE